ncbi:MAG: hypothetical protein RLZZ28_736 [Bacteroidota bacterium]
MCPKMNHMKKLFLAVFLTLSFSAVVNAQQTPAEDSTLQQFVGKYKFPDGSVVAEVVVTLDKGLLTMESSAGASALEKQGEDLYTIVQFQGTAKFNRDANKKVIGVSINAMGYQLEGSKVETAAMNLSERKRYQP